MREPANGARAGRSDWDEAHGIHVVLPQQLRQGMGCGLHMTGLRGPHKGVVKGCDASDDPLLRQFVESIEGKDDIPVLLKACAIKVC